MFPSNTLFLINNWISLFHVGGQPDFLYPASGDTSDYAYGVLGVASLGLEIGSDFYEPCSSFESTVLPDNLPALMYVTKVAKKPFSLGKGPDILSLVVSESTTGEIVVSATASDSQLVNIEGYSAFQTGDQIVTKVELYLDVHPYDYIGTGTMWLMQPTTAFDSQDVSVELTISTERFTVGRHTLFAQATDSDDYAGPVSAVFFNVEKTTTSSPTNEPINASTPSPTLFPVSISPTPLPVAAIVTPSPVTNEPSTSPITASPTNNPSQSPVIYLTPSPVVSSSEAPSSEISESPSVYASTASPAVFTAAPLPSLVPSTDPTTESLFPTTAGSASEKSVVANSPSSSNGIAPSMFLSIVLIAFNFVVLG